MVVTFFLHLADLFFVFHLSPRQLPRNEFYQHVEERPQVVVSAHLLQRMRNKMLLYFPGNPCIAFFLSFFFSLDQATRWVNLPHVQKREICDSHTNVLQKINLSHNWNETRNSCDGAKSGYIFACSYHVQELFPTLFLWAFIDAYRTVPRKPAAVLGARTSPDAFVYCRAKPKSNMYTLCFVLDSLPIAKLDWKANSWILDDKSSFVKKQQTSYLFAFCLFSKEYTAEHEFFLMNMGCQNFGQCNILNIY